MNFYQNFPNLTSMLPISVNSESKLDELSKPWSTSRCGQGGRWQTTGSCWVDPWGLPCMSRAQDTSFRGFLAAIQAIPEDTSCCPVGTWNQTDTEMLPWGRTNHPWKWWLLAAECIKAKELKALSLVSDFCLPVPCHLLPAALPQSQRSSTPSSEIGATPPSSPHHILTWQTGWVFLLQPLTQFFLQTWDCLSQEECPKYSFPLVEAC